MPEDPPTPGALEFVNWMIENGFDVVIHTARVKTGEYPTGAEEVRKWLELHGFPDNLPITSTKVAADLYVDDRGWRFDGDWDSLKDFIVNENFRPGSWVQEFWPQRKEIR